MRAWARNGALVRQTGRTSRRTAGRPNPLASSAKDHQSARYNEVAAAAMKLLAEASTTLAGIKAAKRL
ncbi:MAG TPA: hypothetical protein VF086_13985 [Propionibacteriaceae bacterium]